MNRNIIHDASAIEDSVLHCSTKVVDFGIVHYAPGLSHPSKRVDLVNSDMSSSVQVLYKKTSIRGGNFPVDFYAAPQISPLNSTAAVACDSEEPPQQLPCGTSSLSEDDILNKETVTLTLAPGSVSSVDVVLVPMCEDKTQPSTLRTSFSVMSATVTFTYRVIRGGNVEQKDDHSRLNEDTAESWHSLELVCTASLCSSLMQLEEAEAAGDAHEDGDSAETVAAAATDSTLAGAHLDFLGCRVGESYSKELHLWNRAESILAYRIVPHIGQRGNQSPTAGVLDGDRVERNLDHAAARDGSSFVGGRINTADTEVTENGSLDMADLGVIAATAAPDGTGAVSDIPAAESSHSKLESGQYDELQHEENEEVEVDEGSQQVVFQDCDTDEVLNFADMGRRFNKDREAIPSLSISPDAGMLEYDTVPPFTSKTIRVTFHAKVDAILFWFGLRSDYDPYNS